MRKIVNLKEKLIIIPIFAAMYLLLYFIDATCIIKAISGFPCPFCGMTRAVASIFRLDFLEALRFHPLVLTLPILLWYYLCDGRPLQNRFLNTGLLSLIFSGFVVVWMLRLFGVLPIV